MLSEYEQARPGRVDMRRLTWHVTAGLLMRAKISALRNLADEWPRSVARSVEDASAVWHGQSALLPS